MPDFSHRDTTPELMDAETVEFDDFRRCLVQLTQANVLSFAYRPTIRFFDRLQRGGYFDGRRIVTVVDAGSGYGDMLRKVDAWAVKRGVALQLIGLDLNPWAARAAAEATAPERPMQWVTSDLFDYRPEGGVDIVMSSLFTHHLPDALAIRFLRWMEDTARIGWFVNDLERHPVPYWFLKMAFSLTRRHRFMRHDGPVSVASAFTRADWEKLLTQAHLGDGEARIEPWMPFRLCVSRVKPR